MLSSNYTIQIILSILLITSITFFTLKRNLSYLHIFQQQEYDNHRMFAWIINNLAIDKRLSITLLITFYINLLIFYKFNFLHNLSKLIITNFLTILPISIIAYLEKDPLKFAKKPLILTDRAKRIYYLALFMNFVGTLGILSLKINLRYYLIQLLLIIHLIPLYLIVANILLIPLEKYIQHNYWKLATSILTKYKPLIIGITGSFGKTTVKHFLGHILQQVDHTLITSGSINTPMGIVKTIREELNASHKYFIVEMGAYQIGSINKICQLTPPNFGIITAVGSAHYERFKDLENVAYTKFELAEAVIKNVAKNVAAISNDNIDSKIKVIINQQVLNTEYAKKYLQEHNKVIDVLDPNASISNIVQLKSGLTWDLNIDGIIYKISTPIFGIHNVTNISLACLAAFYLNVPIPIIINSLKTMPQVNHRLEIKQQNNYTIIDDSYNANPDGFKSALELLNFLQTSQANQIYTSASPDNQVNQNNSTSKMIKGRKILITPGLIELGDKHEEEHFKLGMLAAKYVDILIIINLNRIKSFLVGFKQNITVGQQTQILTLDSWQQAQNWLNNNCRPNDIVLIANDLPDLYENKMQI